MHNPLNAISQNGLINIIIQYFFYEICRNREILEMFKYKALF